jgi:hypothetical protein
MENYGNGMVLIVLKKLIHGGGWGVQTIALVKRKDMTSPQPVTNYSPRLDIVNMIFSIVTISNAFYKVPLRDEQTTRHAKLRAMLRLL